VLEAGRYWHLLNLACDIGSEEAPVSGFGSILPLRAASNANRQGTGEEKVSSFIGLQRLA
jgi:hypothetical protein